MVNSKPNSISFFPGNLGSNNHPQSPETQPSLLGLSPEKPASPARSRLAHHQRKRKCDEDDVNIFKKRGKGHIRSVDNLLSIYNRSMRIMKKFCIYYLWDIFVGVNHRTLMTSALYPKLWPSMLNQE